MMKSTSMAPLNVVLWTGCYDSSWKGLITDKSFAHPAKFSRGLIERIYDHCLAKGYLKRGDIVGDPFGGIGTGGITAADRGIFWVGLELEPKFVGFGQENFSRHKKKWEYMGLPLPKIIQGDSRMFDERVAAIVSSPPYAKISPEAHGPGIDVEKNYETYRKSGGGCSLEKFKASREKHSQGYPSSEGQIGDLKPGSVEAVVSSPPYAEGLANASEYRDPEKAQKDADRDIMRSKAGKANDVQYGKTDGQIGALKSGNVDVVISSPPYAGTSGSGGGGINVQGYKPAPGRKWTSPCGNPDDVGKRSYQGQGGDRTDGNIETLKEGDVDAVISSPPYSDISAGAGGLNTKPAKHPGQQSGRSAESASQDTDQKYGTSKGQISQLKGGTFDAVVASPPYNESGKDSGTESHPEKCEGSGQSISLRDGYGESHGQIGNLKSGAVDGVVTSPPWEDNCEGTRKSSKFKNPTAVLTGKRGHGASDAAVLAQAAPDEQKVYGDSEGQIGKETGETYWQAVDAVYRACFRSIRPGGVIILVVKDYVQRGKRVRLCDDTMRLLEHIGFVPAERIHAMLVTETVEAGLFGEERTKRQRKSFFRRLHEDLIQAQLHWVDVKIKPSYLWTAKALVWNAYRDRLNRPTEKEKADPNLWPPPKPTAKKVLREAQFAAWRADGKPVRPDERRIDFEEVLIARRP